MDESDFYYEIEFDKMLKPYQPSGYCFVVSSIKDVISLIESRIFPVVDDKSKQKLTELIGIFADRRYYLQPMVRHRNDITPFRSFSIWRKPFGMKYDPMGDWEL